jgi:transcriptional regulatory protein GAL4
LYAQADETDETNVTDGMASLSVEDKGAGYLGVASGAAMLRLLLPDAEHRGALRRSPQAHTRKISAAQSTRPDLGWVPTPVWLERDIASVDLDSAVNSYFSLYHVSYPIVHEASFRAQYAQVIPRPGGRSWNALAYMIGAIGMFTTSTGPVSRDLDLFEAAKANISIDSLETGNITLVQVLVLMSNYLQKRNKPNSGYNYLGLALNMAMGLGLHKEFHNWRIAPLSMEIRRRVWWCLHVFAIGAVSENYDCALSHAQRVLTSAIRLSLSAGLSHGQIMALRLLCH